MKNDLLVKVISQRGISIRRLSALTGINYLVLRIKLSGILEFKAKEILAISDALFLTNEQVEEIFFGKKVS